MKTILATTLLLLAILGCSSRKPRSSDSKIDKSPAKQEQRSRAIAELVQAGVFDRIEHDNIATRAWIKTGFYRLTFEQKKDVIGVVYARYSNNDFDVILIKDNQTGKIVGTYSLTLGLEME